MIPLAKDVANQIVDIFDSNEKYHVSDGKTLYFEIKQRQISDALLHRLINCSPPYKLGNKVHTNIDKINKELAYFDMYIETRPKFREPLEPCEKSKGLRGSDWEETVITIRKNIR